MKKILFFVMLLLVTNVHAETQKHKPVLCYDLNELVERMMGQYGEKINFTYDDSFYKFTTSISMFVNKETGSWTLIEHDESIGCVLAAGKSEKL